MKDFSGLYIGEISGVGTPGNSVELGLQRIISKEGEYEASFSIDGNKISSTDVFCVESYITACFSEINASVSLDLSTSDYAMTWRPNGAVINLTDSYRDPAPSEKSNQSQGSDDREYILHLDKIGPRMITMLPTYRCNAACENCCFESNPNITTRLTKDQMISRVRMIIDSFPDIQLLVLSGGECFLLGDDLYDVLLYARARGLQTRCVTNGFWGRTDKSASRTVDKLVGCGIGEINISTGFDHQEWVPVEHVIRSVQALTSAGITTLVTVESETPNASANGDSHEYSQFLEHPDIKKLLKDHSDIFSVQINTWMSIREKDSGRGIACESSLDKGCDQLFSNVVVTPHNMMSACCGLTLEHIPELKLGEIKEDSNVKDMYLSQLDDFLKIWIHVDGPMVIMKKLFGEREVSESLENINHICQACAVLHKHQGVKEQLRERYHEFVPDVMARFNLKQAVKSFDENLGQEIVL